MPTPVRAPGLEQCLAAAIRIGAQPCPGLGTGPYEASFVYDYFRSPHRPLNEEQASLVCLGLQTRLQCCYIPGFEERALPGTYCLLAQIRQYCEGVHCQRVAIELLGGWRRRGEDTEGRLGVLHGRQGRHELRGQEQDLSPVVSQDVIGAVEETSIVQGFQGIVGIGPGPKAKQRIWPQGSYLPVSPHEKITSHSSSICHYTGQCFAGFRG